MNPTVEEMSAHVMEICAARRIIVAWCDRPGRAIAMLDLWAIRIPPIRSVITYAAAMHEIGHLLGQYQQTEFVMVAEQWAWVWARNNALIWTDRMEGFAGVALDSYRPPDASI